MVKKPTGDEFRDWLRFTLIRHHTDVSNALGHDCPCGLREETLLVLLMADWSEVEFHRAWVDTLD